MRKLEYLSPTQLMLWKKDPKEYYNKYLSEHRPPRFPQTQAMAIGSAFDARVKSYLYNVVYGSDSNSAFSFEALFDSQVESQNRDWARANEQAVWQKYKELGALQEMVLLLSKSTTAPDFETRITGTISACIDSKNLEPSNSLPLQGVPDVSFSIHDLDIILDWKVNGFLSKASPKRGYIDILPGKMKHKDVFIRMHYGLPCLSDNFENYYDDWALQLTTYSWLLGKPIVNRSLLMIHQIAWDSSALGKCRIAVHSGICSDAYQEGIFRDYCDLWNLVNNYDGLNAYYESNCNCTIDDLEDIAYTNLGNSPEQRLYRELTH